MDFTDKVVVITGSGTGIGAETAVCFAKLGAKLALIDKNQEELDKIGKACQFFCSIPPLTINADLNIIEEVTHLIQCIIKNFLTIDVLVNNAGILELGSLSESSLQQFDRIFNVNVRAAFHLTKLALPYLIQSKGSIVNVSSNHSGRAFPGLIVYNMSQSALDQFTNTLALELAQFQVRVNSVNPGVIRTELHLRAGMTQESYEAYLDRCKQTHPLGRAGTASEVASGIAFLASNRASFITGVNLFIDGGQQCVCPR